MAPTGEEDPREWEILLSAEVEVFLDDLYESDPASHQLVNQAILVLERNGPAEGGRARRLGPLAGLGLLPPARISPPDQFGRHISDKKGAEMVTTDRKSEKR